MISFLLFLQIFCCDLRLATRWVVTLKITKCAVFAKMARNDERKKPKNKAFKFKKAQCSKKMPFVGEKMS